MKQLSGIDVSTLQGAVSWGRVKRAGIDFAYIKATQGRGEGAATRLLPRFTDSRFKANITGADSVGIPCGVYHYLTAQDKQKAIVEIDYFCGVIEPYRSRVKLRAAVDVESKYLSELGRTELTGIVRTALERVEAHGFKPLLYTNPNFLKYRFESGAFDDTELWLAHWKVGRPMAVPRMQIWQYGSGKVDGINAAVDLNYGYFVLDDTAAYRIGGSYTIKAGDVYTNGVSVPARLIGRSFTISQIGNGKILLREINSWIKA